MPDTGRDGAACRARTAASGLVPFALVVVMVAYVLGPGAELLEFGVQLPELTIERVDFVGPEVQATVRNTGPMEVRIAMADINDRIQPAAVEPDATLGRYEAALVRIPFEWNEAEPYRVGITTDDGTRFEREVEAAFPALEPGGDMLVLFTLVGTYVGIIPVMIGLLWLPFLRRIGGARSRFFLSLAAGLLLFLALDSIEEAVAVSGEGLAGGFNGTMLVATVVVLSFLGLYHAGNVLSGRGAGAAGRGPLAMALMISIGIGLHNFGEGLAIGAAVGLGSAAFSAFLILGFALHNTTEGIAIAAPMSRQRIMPARLAALGMVAGSPAIFGAWVGGFAYSPAASVVFLAVGAGAIFQVILALLQWMRADGGGLSGAPVVSGFAAGMAVMYATSILV